MNAGFRFLVGPVAAAVVGGLVTALPAYAQLAALVSPGRLAAAHAQLEGLSNCAKCHEQGRKVTAERCLACHAPVAERIAKKVGVHRNVGTDCVRCHADHAGPDGQLRPFDPKSFDHSANASFPLVGRHAGVAAKCDACHKGRSFLAASSSCASCHTDVHKGSLGGACESCHSTATSFKESSTRFDHTKAAFQLAGAHKAVACAACHVRGAFKGVKFAECTDCHKDRHRPSFGACDTCHTSASWKTGKVNHGRTAFPLVGKHVGVDCIACHTQPAMSVKPAAATCAGCHTDVHRGAFAEDCRACHSESGFGKAPFDHSRTAFRLAGKHEGLACTKCHAAAPAQATVVAPRAARPRASVQPASGGTVSVDFKGLSASCVSCHADVHRGELGTECQSCHSAAGFRLPDYRHQRTNEFFGGQHVAVACAKCHTPAALVAPIRSDLPVSRVAFKAAVRACASCHQDVHLGQVGTECQTCHAIERAKFAAPGFSHATSRFALSGKHQSVACVECHRTEIGRFPSGTGSAVRYRGVGLDCVACHKDVHLGQLGMHCEQCHGSATFKLASYKHASKALSGFFTGRHAKASCQDCHKPTAGPFPGAIGATVRYTVGTACVSCHVDKHRGALGPDCAACHRP